jgi:hypothetical protein
MPPPPAAGQAAARCGGSAADDRGDVVPAGGGGAVAVADVRDREEHRAWPRSGCKVVYFVHRLVQYLIKGPLKNPTKFVSKVHFKRVS